VARRASALPLPSSTIVDLIETRRSWDVPIDAASDDTADGRFVRIEVLGKRSARFACEPSLTDLANERLKTSTPSGTAGVNRRERRRTRNVCIRTTVDDRFDRRARHAEVFRDRQHRCAGHESFADLENGRREPTNVIRQSAADRPVTSLSYHVKRVLAPRPDRQVTRVHARRRVARVHDVLVSGRRMTVGEFPRITVRVYLSRATRTSAELAVAPVVKRGAPQPAVVIAATVDLLPEALSHWTSHAGLRGT